PAAPSRRARCFLPSFGGRPGWSAQPLGLAAAALVLEAALASGAAGASGAAPPSRPQRARDERPQPLHGPGAVLELTAGVLGDHMQHAVAIDPSGEHLAEPRAV